MSRRRVRTWATHSFAAFGVAALLLQSYQAVWDRALLPGHEITVASVAMGSALAYGLVRSWQPRAARRALLHPQCVVEVKPGDLFAMDDAHLVIGFSDTFDTDTADDRIIKSTSVQGQFLHRVYGGDVGRLDRDLQSALQRHAPAGEFSRDQKAYGKLTRYPVGTVAVLGEPRRRYFCLAYSEMSADLVAQSSSDDLWISLGRLWTAVYRHGQRENVAMPVLGTGLARVDALDYSSLIRLICLSFVAASRQRVFAPTLTILVPEAQFRNIDRLELQAFLGTL